MDNFRNLHASHKVGMGLKKDAYKYMKKGMEEKDLDRTKSILADCNLVTDKSNQNLERSLDRATKKTVEETFNEPKRSNEQWADNIYTKVLSTGKNDPCMKYLKKAKSNIEKKSREKEEEEVRKHR